MSTKQNTLALPNSIKRDTYVGVRAQETLKRFTPCNVFDVLQRSYDLAVRNDRIFVQPDNSLTFQVLGCNTGQNVIAVMRPNKELGRQPWAVVFVGYDYDNVLGTCPKLQLNRVITSSKPKTAANAVKAQQKPKTQASATPLYIVCAVWGALVTPGVYPFAASLIGDPLELWALSTRNVVLAIVGLLVGLVMASFASDGYKRRGSSRARRVVGMALLTPVIALLLSTVVLGLIA